MYQKSKCSPLSNKLNNNSCYNQRSLKKIGKILKLNQNSKNLYNDISNKIKKISNCKTEICWLTINSLLNKLSKKDLKELKELFKPIMPKEWNNNNNLWLSSMDIDNVLYQYMKSELDFHIYGTTPINFFKKDLIQTQIINLVNIGYVCI